MPFLQRYVFHMRIFVKGAASIPWKYGDYTTASVVILLDAVADFISNPSPG
jgi:hypothetical protein